MKKALSLAAVVLALTLCLTAAFASGGSATDPLISLSYLEGLFSQSANLSADTSLTEADNDLRNDLQQQLDTMASSINAASGQNYAPIATEITCKEGDVLAGPTGLTVIPLSGDIRVDTGTGAVVDATDGKEVPSGTILSAKHRYIVAEDTAAHFTTISPTATFTYQGNYAFSLSQYAPDYFSIACALRELGLFRGSSTSFGEGFDLHLAPTRAESLVMFIRLLGEEDAALACTYDHPFTDVSAWVDRYVAWAYHQGYSNGISATKFGTADKVRAVEYQEFLLRALGYSIAGIHDYSTSLERALEHGALTGSEYQMLKSDTFLRAQVAYLSYYSLDTVRSGSQQTMAQQLMAAGVFSNAQLSAARQLVNSARLG